MMTRRGRARPNTTGARSAQLPLANIATVTNHSRPRRSAASPPHTLPMPPTAIAKKAMIETSSLLWPGIVTARLAAVNAGIHVQNE